MLNQPKYKLQNSPIRIHTDLSSAAIGTSNSTTTIIYIEATEDLALCRKLNYTIQDNVSGSFIESGDQLPKHFSSTKNYYYKYYCYYYYSIISQAGQNRQLARGDQSSLHE
ncbi:hypothetical protein [Mangrovibacterium lignilyticum]|uniref:hypothetical protein n=1 Tax=Mangrovibacterium lignilyticum TaxID=2668052 RepID=UPI0013D7F44F|nr:hypothetical protein [Mangrovibacterium lignilyticum]